MKKYILVTFALSLILTATVFAQNYLKPEVFKQWLKSGVSVIIVDIQPYVGYQKQHFKNSVATGAYPVETDEDKAKLDGVIPRIMKSNDNVVIIRTSGKMGRVSAGNAYDYFVSKGVSESRLYILEDGIEAWPYQDMLEKTYQEPSQKGKGMY